MQGYRRANGKIGIRNHIAVIYTVECARHVAERIAAGIPGAEVFGFGGCYHDPYGFRMLAELGKHPNVASCILVRIGCESTDVPALLQEIMSSGKRAELVDIQADGGTTRSIWKGIETGLAMSAENAKVARADIQLRDLVIGVECGGSDSTSGLAANPAVGWAVDRIVEAGGTAIFSEMMELLGSDDYLLGRAVDHTVRAKIQDGLIRAKALSNLLHTFAVSAGNEAGGLTTIEEKSLGALCKAGSRPISGVLKTGQNPAGPGLYLLDKVGSIEGNQLTRYEENDNDGLVTLLAAGAHLLIFTTGRGNVIGSVVGPVIKVCGNPETVNRMSDDFDVDAGTIIAGRETVAQVGQKVVAAITRTAAGEFTRAEVLGHREYSIPYKPGRACDVTRC